MFVSLRILVTVLCTTVVVISGSVALGVSLSYALSAADQHGARYTDAIAHSGRRWLEVTFDGVGGLAYGLQQAVANGRMPSPINKTLVERRRDFSMWHSLFYTSYFQMPLMYFSIGFEDDTYVDCFETLSIGLIKIKTEAVSCRFRDMINGTNDTEFPATDYVERINITTGAINNSVWSKKNYRPTQRPWYRQVSHTFMARSWSNVYLETDYFKPIIDVIGAVFDPERRFVGIVSLSFRLDDLSDRLRMLPRTENSAVALVDNNGDMLASTRDADIPFLSSGPCKTLAELNATKPEHRRDFESACFLFLENNSNTNTFGPCSAYNKTSDNSTATPSYLCRLPLSEYPHAALRDMAPLLEQAGNDATKRRIGGALHFATVVKINTARSSNMSWRVVTVIPEGDATRLITTGRNLAIAFVTVTIVICVLFSLATARVLLRPLERVADRMYLAARFQEGGDDGPLPASAIAEVQAIQKAFSALSEQVRRARQYLPVALLDAGGGGDDASADASDDDDDHHRREGTTSNDRDMPSESGVYTSPGLPPDTSQGSGSFSFWASNSREGDQQHSREGRPLDESDGVPTAPAIVISSPRAAVAAAAVAVDPPSPVGALRSELGLARRRVTVVYANVRDFNHIVTTNPPEGTLAEYAGLVAFVGATATELRGVLDSFHGDRFTVTFNATRPCPRHTSCAVRLALNLSARGRTIAFTAGVGTGGVYVGNLGSCVMRRFHVIGQAFSRAVLLERLCKTFDLPVLVTDAAVADAGAQAVRCLPVDAVPQLSRRGNGRDKLQYVTLYSVSEADIAYPDGWLFSLPGPTDADGLIDGAVRALVEGDDNKAREALLSCCERRQQMGDTMLGEGPVGADIVLERTMALVGRRLGLPADTQGLPPLPGGTEGSVSHTGSGDSPDAAHAITLLGTSLGRFFADAVRGGFSDAAMARRNWLCAPPSGTAPPPISGALASTTAAASSPRRLRGSREQPTATAQTNVVVVPDTQRESPALSGDL